MRPIHVILLTGAAVLALAGYTKLIWQSGFDQGSDVALCVVASFQNDGKLATHQPACQKAGRYKSNPLWLLRRRAA